MKKILIALVAVIVIAVGANFLFPSVNSLTDFKHRLLIKRSQSITFIFIRKLAHSVCSLVQS